MPSKYRYNIHTYVHTKIFFLFYRDVPKLGHSIRPAPGLPDPYQEVGWQMPEIQIVEDDRDGSDDEGSIVSPDPHSVHSDSPKSGHTKTPNRLQTPNSLQVPGVLSPAGTGGQRLSTVSALSLFPSHSAMGSVSRLSGTLTPEIGRDPLRAFRCNEWLYHS